jgi:hypothetical protein
MDNFVTIEPDFETPSLDRHLETSRKNQKPFKYREWWYKKHPLEVNPKWKLCFSGR